jgi:hypothetical protein
MKNVDCERFAGLSHICPEAVLHQGGPENLFLARELREITKVAGNCRGKIALEHRQELLADARSQAADVAVGCVFPPPFSACTEVFAKIAPAGC